MGLTDTRAPRTGHPEARIGRAREQGYCVMVAHDYFTQLGGAERVALAMLEAFPGSALLTSIYLPTYSHPVSDATPVRRLWVDRFPCLRRRPRRTAPLLAFAWGRAKVRATDVVLASTSFFAHWLRTDGPMIIYCHTPARWLYLPENGLPGLPRWAHPLWRVITTPVRWVDRRAAGRADLVLANSHVVAHRVLQHWGLKAQVLHPPPGLDAHGPQLAVPGLEPGFLLTIGRERAYKNVGSAVEAVRGLPGVHLVCVGSAGDPDDPDNVVRLRELDDAQLRWLYANSVGVLALAHEDFGLTPIEAQGFGVPTLALRADGYLDSTTEGLTGLFVDDLEPDTLRNGIEALLLTDWDPLAIREVGESRFGVKRFEADFREIVGQVLQRRAAAHAC